MKRLLVLSVGLLASASMFGDKRANLQETAPVATGRKGSVDVVETGKRKGAVATVDAELVVKPEPGLVAAPTRVAPTPIAILATPQTATCEKHAPYGDVASVMEDGTVLDIIGSIPGVKEIRDPVKKLGEVVRRLEKIDIDLCKLVQTGSDVYKKAICLKVDETKRKASAACGTVDCNGSRIACIVKTLEKVKMMVAIIVQDFFLGYQEGNKKVEGMIYLMLDVVGRKNAGDLKTKVDPILEKALNVLGVVEDLLKKIPATTTPAASAPATIKASAPTTEK